MTIINKEQLQEQLQPLLEDAVKSAATDLIKNYLPISRVKEAIERALKRQYDGSQFEAEIDRVLEYLLRQEIRSAMEKSDFQTHLQSVIADCLSSEEYKECLRQRVKTAIEQTTIYVKLRPELLDD